MEEFIETEGRWATAEDEAEMRMTARRGVRERREAEEAGGDTAGTVVLDDDEDEGDATAVGLGEGSRCVRLCMGSERGGEEGMYFTLRETVAFGLTSNSALLF